MLCYSIYVSFWDLLPVGQNPYKWSASKSGVVAHQSKPSDLPAAVHPAYRLPLSWKGKAHAAPLAFPNSVKRSEGAKEKLEYRCGNPGDPVLCISVLSIRLCGQSSTSVTVV